MFTPGHLCIVTAPVSAGQVSSLGHYHDHDNTKLRRKQLPLEPGRGNHQTSTLKEVDNKILFDVKTQELKLYWVHRIYF